MTPRRPLFLLVVLVACAPVEVEIKPRAVSTNVSAGADSSMVCGDKPFGTSSIDFAALEKEAGIDLSQGCLKSVKFTLTAEVTSLTHGQGCVAPRGLVTMPEFDIELTCADQTVAVVPVLCPKPTIDVADGTDIFQKINACLDVVETQENDRLRRLINSCRPTALRAYGKGTCSADVCFAATFKISFAYSSAVAQLGGTCP